MAFCPNCKYEFREGITVCSDCGATLVDDLSLFSSETKKETSEILTDDITVKEGDLEASDLEENTEGEISPEDFVLEYDDAEEIVREFKRAEPYVNNEEKAEDNKSSALVLLTLGAIGIVGVILFFTGIIPNNLTTFSKYIICGVMGAMFVLFFVMGVVSMRNFKSFSEKAHKENNLSSEIRKWCSENMSRESIDASYPSEELDEELKYFERVKKMRELITNQFMNLNDAYLDRLIDEVYSDIFDESGEEKIS